ncbi:hypothetical protein NQZ68_014692 [Dissostichus eleginoides]|nr:hypothetical protein NQZ68_014692 [Dissostichus eleginoides]
MEMEVLMPQVLRQAVEERGHIPQSVTDLPPHTQHWYVPRLLEVPHVSLCHVTVHEKVKSEENRSTSCSPSHPFTQETDHPEPRPPTPEDPPGSPLLPSQPVQNQAMPKPTVLQLLCLMRDPLRVSRLSSLNRRSVWMGTHWRLRWDKNPCSVQRGGQINTEPEDPPDPTGDLEVREPPEGQQGRGVADGRASGTNTPDSLGLQTEHTFLSPLSMAVGSPEEVSSTSTLSSPPLAPQLTSPAPPVPSPHPLREQFPSEHIQRIQAAGFSAREAAEALEQAQGVVELALLALLARSITVPT